MISESQGESSNPFMKDYLPTVQELSKTNGFLAKCLEEIDGLTDKTSAILNKEYKSNCRSYEIVNTF